MRKLIVFLFVCFLAASTATTHAGPRWIVTLSDDSRILIKPDCPTLSVASNLLDKVIPIPTSAIRAVTPDSERDVKVELANGDRISGCLVGDPLAAEALFGPISIRPEYIRRIEVTDASEDVVLAKPLGEFQVDYAGLRWDLMRTGWKVEGGRLASQRYARPGFKYGHWANGRGGIAMTGIGDKSWVDYEVTFDFKMLPANREFFHAHIPGDSRGMSVAFRVKSASESWNQPHTSYSFGLRPNGNWSMGVSEDYHMPGHGWSANRKGKTEKLASGKYEKCQDASEGRLRLRVKGNTITVSLNDEQLVEHTHEGEVVGPIPYGGFGVGWRYESMGWISNLTVKKL